jgi:hypothetical protein
VEFGNLVTIKEKGCQIKKGKKKIKTHESKTYDSYRTPILYFGQKLD